jgi:hypothetical protein
MSTVHERTFRRQGIEISTRDARGRREAGRDSVRFTYGRKAGELATCLSPWP